MFFGAFVLFPGGMVWCYTVFHTQPALCFVNCVLLCCSAAEDGLYLARSCGALSQRALRPVLCSAQSRILQSTSGAEAENIEKSESDC